MIEGPGARALDKIKEQVDKEMEWCHEAAVLHARTLVIDYRPLDDHITMRQWRRDDRLARRFDALLRHAQGTSRLESEDVKRRDCLQDFAAPRG